MKILSLLNQTLINALSTLEYPEKEIKLSPPKNPDFGDISTNLPLILSKELKMNPMKIGEKISNVIDHSDGIIDKITVTNPGFINFTIGVAYYYQILEDILSNESYGNNLYGKGQKANVEFVSANPTGPLTVGHGRNAVLGDSVANILEWNGYEVTREYYFNDAGRQMRILGESVEFRYRELIGKESDFPEGGYEGLYIIDIAKLIIKEHGKSLNTKDPIFKDFAEKTIFLDIKNSLLNIGIKFDKFSNEKSFYDNGQIDKFLNKMKSKDLIYEKDGATWFRSTSLGKEQDRVYIKSSGEPTYRVPDTVYHQDKINRGYNLIIDIFGADHADTYPDVLIALDALGMKTDHIHVLLYQFVTLLRSGEKVKMSTRKANFVTMDELVKEVNPDVLRYFFVMRGMNTHLNFDLDLATDQSEKNPVFYLQYAHARICNIIKRYEALDNPKLNNYDLSLLTHQSELRLLKKLEQFPQVIENSRTALEPQTIATYLYDTANNFHRFYSDCRVITEDKDLTRSRIALIQAVKIVLRNGLTILGITAPERM
ncbi:MAG: arginine--tRNA ligase [Candidatus Marinimicrobia bacterium]|jgi:arginyl-tRNA synthetase|nr:arginine--tRNA ligase [Candidatus Neomarinimicrobiota bacterium]